MLGNLEIAIGPRGWSFWLFALFAWLFGVAGCNTVPVAFPQEFAVTAQQMSTSIADQALWSKIVADIDGQVIEPGIEVRAGVIYIAQSKLTGVSGQIRVAADGQGSGTLSPEARTAILAIANKYNVTPEQLSAFIASANAPAPASQPVGEMVEVVPQ